MNTKLLALYGLKFHPFHADVPTEALYATPGVDAFLRRVQLAIADGGFAMLTGDPGTGKTIALRLLADRLRALPNVVVGTIEHPQSRTSDFYRELGDLFGIPLAVHNRWAGFKALRTRWSEHIASTLLRPVLIIDEAQEALTTVLSELRILASKDFDSGSCSASSSPATPASPSASAPPSSCPSAHASADASSSTTPPATSCSPASTTSSTPPATPSLMTTELKATLADHAAGNYRVLMNLADELLTVAADRDLPRLDEKLFLDVFAQAPKPKPTTRKR